MIESKWYIIRTRHNFEKKVLETLNHENDRGSLKNMIKRTITPIEKSTSVKDGKKIIKDKFIFPGYIFVETEYINELKYFVKGCYGAIGMLVDRSNNVQSLKSEEAHYMISQQDNYSVSKLNEGEYEVGDKVSIIDGVFEGMSGVIDEINGSKIKLLVSVFDRDMKIDFSDYQIDKIIL